MSVVALADVKLFLNITDSARNDELQTFIDAAESIIVAKKGFLDATTYTARVDGDVPKLALPHTPVATLTSVTGKSGTVVTDTYLNQRAGLVERNDGTYFSEAYYTVVYSAGYTTTPDYLLEAVKELTKHLWKSQTGATARPNSDTNPTAGYLLPYRVQSLLDLDAPMGFA